MWTNQPPDRDDEKHARGAHSEAYRHGNVPRTLLSVSHRATSAAHPRENVRGRMSGGHAMPNPRPWMATVYIYCLIYCAEEARRGWETMVWCCRSGDVDGVWMYSSGSLKYPIYNTCLCHFIQSYHDNCHTPACLSRTNLISL